MKKDVRILKIYGFVLFMGVGTYFPYIWLYMREIGFSNAQIGILGALGPGVMMVCQPLWGWVSDKTKKPEKVALGLSIGVIFALLLMTTAKSFIQMFLYVALFNIFYSSLIPTFDTIVISTIEDSEVSYGQIRWLGSLGFALTAMIVGQVIELTDNSIILWIYIGIALLLAFMSTKLPKARPTNDNMLEDVKVGPLLKNRELIIFLTAATFIGGSLAMYNTFYPFLIKDLGGGEGLLGWSMLVSAFSEIPLMFYSSKLLKRYKPQSLLLVAFGVAVLRWFLKSIAISPYQIVFLQLLHSIVFGIFYSTSVVYISRLVPERLRASGQNLFWATTFGLGNVTANLIAGWLYEYNTVQTVFRAASISATIGFIIMLVEIQISRDKI